jgi:hypothetical protein
MINEEGTLTRLVGVLLSRYLLEKLKFAQDELRCWREKGEEVESFYVSTDTLHIITRLRLAYPLSCRGY